MMFCVMLCSSPGAILKLTTKGIATMSPTPRYSISKNGQVYRLAQLWLSADGSLAQWRNLDTVYPTRDAARQALRAINPEAILLIA
jgi:hypothetical protein